MRWTRALALSVALLAGCAIIQPIGDAPVSRLQTEWARPLYDLESFAYKPLEAGTPIFVKTAATPPAGIVVVPSNDRFVRALDARNGEVVWATETTGPVTAQPVIQGEDLLIASLDGYVYRLRQRNGRQVWRSDFLRGGVRSQPTVEGERVFVTTIDNRLTALELETGKRLWDRKRPHQGEFTITGQSGALVLDETVVTGFSDGQLVAFALSDGATVWTSDLRGGKTEFVDIDATPQLADDLIVTGSYAVGLFGLTVDEGKVKWLVKGEGYTTPTVEGSEIFVSQADGRVLAIDAESGRVKWVTKLESEGPSRPALTRKYVLVAAGPSLVVIDRSTGRVAEQILDTYGFSATPEMAWGTVYAQSNSGVLYALGIY